MNSSLDSLPGNESARKSVKYSDFAKSLQERLTEGRRVKGNHNSQKIYFGKNNPLEEVQGVSQSKESLMAEVARKREFIS